MKSRHTQRSTDNDSTAFDYDSVDRACDGRCEADDPTDSPARTYTQAEFTQGLGELVRWVIGGGLPLGSDNARIVDSKASGSNGSNSSPARTLNAPLIGKRGIAAAFILCPGALHGLSLAAIGRLPGVNASRKSLSDHTTDFTRRFGVRSRALRTDTEREHMSEVTRERHRVAQDARELLVAQAGKSDVSLN